MGKRAALACVFTVLSLPCSAGEIASDSHSQAAVALLDVMDAERMMLGGATAMSDAMIQQNPALGPYRDVILDWAASFMTWEVFGPQLVAIYTEAFTETELNEITAFYETPVGRKSLDLMPQLMSRSSTIGAEEAQRRAGRLEAMIRQRAEELAQMQSTDSTVEE